MSDWDGIPYETLYKESQEHREKRNKGKQMRLIDANTIAYVPLDDVFNCDVMVAHKERIDSIPTVEAIPVEFIKGEIKDNKGFYNSSLRRLLDVWTRRRHQNET